jgi:hypothetical protein
MPKLTKLFASNVKPPDKGQVIYRDTAVIGLGLRVTTCYAQRSGARIEAA